MTIEEIKNAITSGKLSRPQLYELRDTQAITPEVFEDARRFLNDADAENSKRDIVMLRDGLKGISEAIGELKASVSEVIDNVATRRARLDEVIQSMRTESAERDKEILDLITKVADNHLHDIKDLLQEALISVKSFHND